MNVNIAATTVENYRRLKEAGIGTYILFQETYHKESYESCTSPGPKHDYAYHTEAMDWRYGAAASTTSDSASCLGWNITNMILRGC